MTNSEETGSWWKRWDGHRGQYVRKQALRRWKAPAFFKGSSFICLRMGIWGKLLLTPLVCQDWELLPVLLQGRILAEFLLEGYLLSTPVAVAKLCQLLNILYEMCWNWRLLVNLQQPLHLCVVVPLSPPLPSFSPFCPPYVSSSFPSFLFCSCHAVIIWLLYLRLLFWPVLKDFSLIDVFKFSCKYIL